jgi:hypothetical protein
VAEAALEAGLGFALILDEVQNLSAAHYEALVMALRRAKQKEGVPSEQTVVVPRPSSKSVVRVSVPLRRAALQQYRQRRRPERCRRRCGRPRSISGHSSEPNGAGTVTRRLFGHQRRTAQASLPRGPPARRA